MPVISRLSERNTAMTVNADLARIYGSDLDSISLAPIGTPLPTTIGGALNPAFEDVGWLHSDGVKESPTGSKSVLRGFQGAKVVRTRLDEPGTTIGFTALETKAQTKSLRYDEKSVSVSGGVRQVTRGAGQKVQPRAAVIDFYDIDNTTVKERWCIDRLEIVPDGDKEYTNSDISGFPFVGEIIGDYITFESAGGATASVWNLTVSGAPTGGSYFLTVNDVSTAPIAYNAIASAVAAAINALSGVTGISGVTASGTSPMAITFPSAVTLTANGSGLTGGTNPGVTVA